jgi:hypothetical protein
MLEELAIVVDVDGVDSAARRSTRTEPESNHAQRERVSQMPDLN